MAERVVSVKLKADIAQYVASMRTAGRATSDLEKSSLRVQEAFSAEEDAAGRVRVAEVRLAEVRKNSKASAAQLAQAEERLASAQRAHAAARDRAIVTTEQFIDDQRRLAAAAGEASEAVEQQGRATEQVARRANIRFRAVMTGIVAGLPAASAAAVAAATGIVGAGFAGLGAVALRNNAQIRDSFSDLSSEVQAGLAADAAVLTSTYVGVANRLGQAYQQLRPQMRDAFAASSPAVEHLTEGVIALAQNAMPGLLTSVQRSEPVFEGLRGLLGEVGSGVGEFAEELSNYSAEAGVGMEHLGSLIRGVLGETAPLLGTLTTAWAEHGDEVAEVITQIIGVVGGLAGSAMPALSTATGAALQVLSGVLDVIEPMLPVLGPLVGTWLSLAAAMKAIGSVRGVIGSAASSVGDLATSMRDAETRGSRLRRVAGAVALGIAGIVAESRRLNPNVEAMTGGLAEFGRTGRLSGEAARVLGTDMEDLNYAIGAVNSNDFDKAITTVAEAITGLVGYAPFEEAQERIAGIDSSLADMVRSGNADAASAVIRRLAEETGRSVEEVEAALPGYSAAMEEAAKRSAELGTSALQSMPGIRELEESLATLADQTADTADRADALNDAWKRLFGISLSLKDAQAEFESGLDDISESINGVKEDTAAWSDALFTSSGAVNLATEEGRELHELLTAEGEAYRTLAITAYDTARQQGKSQQEATAIAVESVRKRREQFIREQVTLGISRERAEALADEYFGLPEQVVTAIRTPGLLTAMDRLRQFREAIYSIPLTRTMTLSAIIPGQALMAMQAMRALGMADGGILRFAEGSEDHRAQIAPAGAWRVWAEPETGGEAYIPLAQSKRARSTDILATVANQFGYALAPVVRRYADGGVSMVRGAPSPTVTGGGVTVIVNAPNYVGDRADLVRALRKEVAVAGGDVQKVLGRS